MDAKSQSMAVELISDPEQGGFTARLPDVPAYGEGETEEAAIDDLREALRGYIEAFGINDVLERLVAPITIRNIDLNLADLDSSV